MVILGAGLLIALVVVTLLSSGTSLMGPNKAESDAYWSSLTPIRIDSSKATNGSLVLRLQNSGNERIWLTGIRIGSNNLDLRAYLADNSYGDSYCNNSTGIPVCNIYLQVGKPVYVTGQYVEQCAGKQYLQLDNITLTYRTSSISGFTIKGTHEMVVSCSTDNVAAATVVPSPTPSPIPSPAPFAMLSGQVTDTYGIGVSGATVNLTNSSTAQYATANASGHYSLNVSLGGSAAAFVANASAGSAYNYSTAVVSLSAGVAATRDFVISALSPIEFILFIKDDSGNNVAAFTPTGDVVLKGGCYSGASGSCASPSGSVFEMKDAGGAIRAYVNSSGSLCIEDSNCNDYDANCAGPAVDSFVVQNSTGQYVSYISPAGSMCLIGNLRQYGTP